MPDHGRAWKLAALVGALAGLSWRWADNAPPHADPPALRPGVVYVADPDGGRVAVELPAEPGFDTYLVLGSLGDPLDDYEVTLQLKPSGDGAASVLIALPSAHGLTERANFDGDGKKASGGRQPPVRVGTLNSLSHEQGADGPRSPDLRIGGDVREDSLHVTDGPLDDPRQYARVRSRLLAEGRAVRVYLDEQVPAGRIARSLADEIVRLFDTEILPALGPRFGTCRDVDGDGKLAVVLTPWLGRLRGGRASLGGMVRSADFRPETTRPFGSAADLMFLNSEIRPGPHLRALLAHEWTHALCFGTRFDPARPAPLPAEDDWLNEAIAHVAETLADCGWTNRAHRVAAFLEAPSRSPLLVPDYYRAGLWRDDGCRGATFLFLQWCVDRFGDDLPRRLIAAPATGARNIEHATGVPFPHLFRCWSVSLLASSQPTKTGWRTADGTPLATVTALPLTGSLGSEFLTGPHVATWDRNRERMTLRLRGTAVAYLRLPAETTAGARRLVLEADAAARLQVSIVRQPAAHRPSEQRPGHSEILARLDADR